MIARTLHRRRAGHRSARDGRWDCPSGGARRRWIGSVALGRRGIAIRHLAREQRSLEDLFFRLTENTA